jgi:GT2 family glycosyltransferase
MFSLIIPAYNRGSLIAQTLETVLHQSTQFDEIIRLDWKTASSGRKNNMLAKLKKRFSITSPPAE